MSSLDITQRAIPYTKQEQEGLQAQLDGMLGPEYVNYRPAPGGSSVAYLRGDVAITLANEIFGFNGWSSEIKDVAIDEVCVFGYFGIVKAINADGCFTIVSRKPRKVDRYHLRSFTNHSQGRNFSRGTPSPLGGYLRHQKLTDVLRILGLANLIIKGLSRLPSLRQRSRLLRMLSSEHSEHLEMLWGIVFMINSISREQGE